MSTYVLLTVWAGAKWYISFAVILASRGIHDMSLKFCGTRSKDDFGLDKTVKQHQQHQSPNHHRL